MRKTKVALAVGVLSVIAVGSVDARSSRPSAAFDGPWHLAFTTQAGPCDPAYAFDVNISNGNITEPNLHAAIETGSARGKIVVEIN